MISGQKMQDIGWFARRLNNQEIKDYVIRHWDLLQEISKTADDSWADILIDALSKENFEQIKKLI